MATEHFCLRWNNHQSTLVSVFDNLLESGTLVDCTLAADGRYLKAHKVVLSACSPYLGMLLSQHYDKHPIIILKDVKFDELKAMLDYMYRGEVNISQEQLSTFLKAAETLQIKGLTDAGSDEGNGLQPNRPPSSTSTTSANEDPPSPGPPGEGGSSPGPRKRKRNKHGDDGEGDSMSKISLSESSDRLSGTSVGSPSAKSASVKREPGDGEGDGQMSVDESGEVVMMSRPGPSNGGTNNKAPWILSADSSGEEMQLTPGQDGRCNGLVLENGDIKEDGEENENAPEIIEEGEIREEIKREVKDQFDLGTNQHQEENCNGTLLIAVARDREELIVPDTLEVSPFLFEKNYHHPPPKSVSETVQKNNKQQEANNQKVILKDNLPGIDCQLDTKLTIVKPTEESPSKRSPEKCMLEPAMRSNTGTVKKVRWNVVSQNSASHLRSLKKVIEKVHISSDGPETLDNSHSQSCLKSSSPAKGSKTVVRVADVFNTNKVKVKKTRLDFLTKYRKILPAPEDESGKVSSFQIVGARIPPASVEQSINQSLPQPSATPASGENQPDNLTRMPPTNTLNPKETKAINHSEIQGSSLEQKVNQNPSLIQISQQFQGSQFLSNTPNALLMPQQLQTGQVNSLGQAVLTIPPQFSIPSPVQAGNFQMQFSNNSNIPSGNIQMMNNLSGVITQGQVSQPVFVTSNIISTCQTSNQFLSSSPVQYNFSTPTAQPNCSVAVSQSTLTSATYQKINVPANPPSSSSILNSYGYLRRPRMRMRLTPKVGQVQSPRGRGEFSTHQAQGRLPLQSGRVPSVRPSLNLGPKPILPKP